MDEFFYVTPFFSGLAGEYKTMFIGLMAARELPVFAG
jgi:hypothetical protein